MVDLTQIKNKRIETVKDALNALVLLSIAVIELQSRIIDLREKASS